MLTRGHPRVRSSWNLKGRLQLVSYLARSLRFMWHLHANLRKRREEVGLHIGRELQGRDPGTKIGLWGTPASSKEESKGDLIGIRGCLSMQEGKDSYRSEMFFSWDGGSGCWSAPLVIMKLISWNFQGLGNPWTVRSLLRLVREKKPTVVFLIETKLQ